MAIAKNMRPFTPELTLHEHGVPVRMFLATAKVMTDRRPLTIDHRPSTK